MISKFILPPVIILTLLSTQLAMIISEFNTSVVMQVAVFLWYYLVPMSLAMYIGYEWKGCKDE